MVEAEGSIARPCGRFGRSARRSERGNPHGDDAGSGRVRGDFATSLCKGPSLETAPTLAFRAKQSQPIIPTDKSWDFGNRWRAVAARKAGSPDW